MLGPGSPPQPFPEAQEIPLPTNGKELAAAIQKLGDELARSGRFSGTVLVAADDKTLLNAAWGEADRSAKVRNTPETAYDVGSIGKLFTQIAVLQLAESGKLSLDDTMGKYLTDYPDKEIATKITIRELLEHSSGIPDFLSHVTPEMKIDTIVDLKDFLPLFAKQPLEFEPGSTKRYSNSGYIVLGLVIEAASKENYRHYIEKHIIEPAGMKRSGFFDRTSLPPFVARSYEGSDDVTSMHARLGSSAGGLQASAADLLRLVEAINAGKLIKAQSIGELRRMIPRPPNAPPPADENKLMAYGINGGGPGVGAELVIDPSGRYTRIVHSNAGPPMTMSMGATIRQWLSGMSK